MKEVMPSLSVRVQRKKHKIFFNNVVGKPLLKERQEKFKVHLGIVDSCSFSIATYCRDKYTIMA